APMAYAVVSDPGAVDTPDVPSYQPYVYGRLDPPALIPLQMKEIDLAVDCALDTAAVTLRARWWLHCITRSRECDVRLVVPMGEQGSILGAEVTVGRMSYNTQVTEVEDQTMENTMKGILKPHMFCLTIPQVEGGADIVATVRWSQKLHYDNGRFTVDIPFRFPYYVNPLPKVFMKREKIQLTVNSGFSKEVLLQGTSHSLKEKARQGDKLSFLHEAVVENWSNKDFTFSYSVYSGDLSGGIHVQPSISQDYDDRDTFSIFILPGSGNRKVFKKAVVFVVDTSGSMKGKPLENVKNAVSTALSELVQGDYFNIITFNEELHSFSSCLEKVNEKAIASANDWMNANFVAEGGTDIMHPLNEVLSLF
uniref:VWFA domain-containing protein n=1 Tax=Aegilops tauschii subsp. strangulata TaxID=200361 RepID=A0A453B3S2_AEGTS